MKIEGLDELDKLSKDLEELGRRANALEGEHNIPLKELFSTTFIAKNTSFASSDEFFSTMPDLDEDEEALDSFTKQNTVFETWDELIDAGLDEYLNKTLYDGIF